MTTTATALVDYHQLNLAPAGASPVLDPAQPLTLVQVADGGRSLIINTGIASGPVHLSVGGDDGSAPSGSATSGSATSDPPTAGDWEERQVVVMSIDSDLFVSSPTVMDSGIEGAVFEPVAPGEHQVTVLARGRSGHYDEYLEPGSDPTEDYLVTIVPV